MIDALRFRVPTLIGALFALIAWPLAAQDGGPDASDESMTGRVSGTVVAETLETPLPGVDVSVVGTRLRAVSDARGRFRISGVPAGRATLRFRHLGYGTVSEEVAVADGAETTVRVALPTEPVELSPVRVLMERTRLVGDPLSVHEIPGAAHFLSRQDLEAQKLAFDNVHNAIRQLPGVNVQDEEGYGLRPNIGLRGTGVERSSKITLMEDGVLIAPAPYAASSAYYFPVVGRMEAVEVRKGSSQVRYGPRTIGGAVNLVSTSIPEDLRWTMDLSGGEDTSLKGRAWVGDSSEHFGWLVETYQIRTDGFKRLPGDEDTGFEIGDYMAKLRVNTDRDADTYQAVELKLGYTDEISNETYLGLTETDFERSPLLRYPASQPDRMDAEHRQIQARWFVRPGEALDLTTTVYRNDFHRNWYKLHSVLGTGISSVLDDPETHATELAILKGADSEAGALHVRANNREYVSQGVQSVLGIRVDRLGGHDLELGARFHQDEEDRFQWEDAYQMVDASMALTSRGAPGSQSNRVSDAEALSFYLQDEIRLGSWTLVPGLRYETIDFTRTDYATDDPERTAPTRVRENEVSAWIPGMGVSYAAAPGLQLFGGVHRGFGPPGPGAEEETRPEQSVNYELGGRLRRGWLGVQLTGFYSDYENILGKATLATGETGAGDLFNGGAVDVLGIEAAVDYDFADRLGLPVGIPVRVAYTFTDAEFRTSFESDYDPWGAVDSGDELPYLPEHQFYGSVGVTGGGWGLTLSSFGNTAMRTRAGQGTIPGEEGTDGFVVFNLSGEYELPGYGTVYGAIQNLTDERYVVARRPAGARPGLPRTFVAGFRLSR